MKKKKRRGKGKEKEEEEEEEKGYFKKNLYTAQCIARSFARQIQLIIVKKWNW